MTMITFNQMSCVVHVVEEVVDQLLIVVAYLAEIQMVIFKTQMVMVVPYMKPTQ